MEFFRKANQRKMMVWSVLLSLVLLLAQGVTLHVHSLEHDHTHHAHQDVIDESPSHSHMSNAHVSIDATHADHHDEIISEIEITPNGVVKLFSSQLLVVAFIVFLLILPLLSVFRRLPSLALKANVSPYKCYLFSPPLRAPPLS